MWVGELDKWINVDDQAADGTQHALEQASQPADSAGTQSSSTSIHTDVGLLIRERCSEEVSVYDALWSVIVPLGCALLCACTWLFVPFHFHGRTYYWVVEFFMYAVWGGACSIGTTTYLDAVAPASDRLVTCTAMLGAAACPLFWLLRLAVEGGTLEFDHSSVPYSYVILFAITVPVLCWLIFSRDANSSWVPRTDLVEALMSDTNVRETDHGPTDCSQANPSFSPDEGRDADITSSDLLSIQESHEIVLYGKWSTRISVAVAVVVLWSLVYASLAAFLKIFLDHDPGQSMCHL